MFGTIKTAYQMLTLALIVAAFALGAVAFHHLAQGVA